MSRVSRVPYHQNIYDLLGAVDWGQLESGFPPLGVLSEFRLREVVRESQYCDTWERETGLVFPAAMRETYARLVRLKIDPEPRLVEPPTLRRWFSQFEEDDYISPLSGILEHVPQPDPHHVPGGAEPGPYFFIGAESQAAWIMYARYDGGDDPQVYATRWCWLSPSSKRSFQDNVRWHQLGRFSDVLYRWFVLTSGIPSCPPWGDNEYWRSRPMLEFMPEEHQNGLWLRTPAEPFHPPVIDFLIDQFGEPEITPRAGNVSTYTFRPSDGVIRVTADEPTLVGGLSAWWVHADTRERLAELGRLLFPWGTLRETLRADTDPAREVLQSLQS